MKTKLPLFVLFSFLSFFACTNLFAQVGIGTITPTETLDVVGNIKYTGALMPNGDAGSINSVLLSGGADNPPVWGPDFLNNSQTTSIGKSSKNLTIPTGASTHIIPDTNCVISSTCFVTWNNTVPATNLQSLNIVIKAEAGQWIFYIDNQTTNIINSDLNYIAFY